MIIIIALSFVWRLEENNEFISASEGGEGATVEQFELGVVYLLINHLWRVLRVHLLTHSLGELKQITRILPLGSRNTDTALPSGVFRYSRHCKHTWRCLKYSTCVMNWVYLPQCFIFHKSNSLSGRARRMDSHIPWFTKVIAKEEGSLIGSTNGGASIYFFLWLLKQLLFRNWNEWFPCDCEWSWPSHWGHLWASVPEEHEPIPSSSE